ncbi:hypothetical protein [Asticcacaulis sp. W401b]|uniref:hypothetical protein n=1 Tax=Asticcacaulis sp. W401b TaxID=3388666 RepID=UPI00397076E0
MDKTVAHLKSLSVRFTGRLLSDDSPDQHSRLTDKRHKSGNGGERQYVMDGQHGLSPERTDDQFMLCSIFLFCSPSTPYYQQREQIVYIIDLK